MNDDLEYVLFWGGRIIASFYSRLHSTFFSFFFFFAYIHSYIQLISSCLSPSLQSPQSRLLAVLSSLIPIPIQCLTTAEPISTASGASQLCSSISFTTNYGHTSHKDTFSKTHGATRMRSILPHFHGSVHCSAVVITPLVFSSCSQVMC